MADSSSEVRLPESVESMLRQICDQQRQSPPDNTVRIRLAELGEVTSLILLRRISSLTIKRSLSGFILHLAKDYMKVPTKESICESPQKRCYSPSTANSPNGVSSPSSLPKCQERSPPSTPECRANRQNVSPQLLVLSELEFRKAFLILSYIGRKKLEDHMAVNEIERLKDLPMRTFETEVWEKVGQRCCEEKEDRRKYLDWDSGKTHLYHCHVYQDGSYCFKGPYLGTTRTHLQRELGDENVLIVKFSTDTTACTNRVADSSDHTTAAFNRIAKEGILVALRRYRFFGDISLHDLNMRHSKSSVLLF